MFRSMYQDKFLYGVSHSDNTIWWQICGKLSLAETVEIISIIKKEVDQLKSGEIKLLVDNSKMFLGSTPLVFLPEVNEKWEEFQGWLIPHCLQVAVVCNAAMMKMQMDRLSRKSGLHVKSFFNPQDRKSALNEAMNYLDIYPQNINGLL